MMVWLPSADLAAVDGPEGTAVAIAWLGEVLIALSRSVTAYYAVRSLPQPALPPATVPASSSRWAACCCSRRCEAGVCKVLCTNLTQSLAVTLSYASIRWAINVPNAQMALAAVGLWGQSSS